MQYWYRPRLACGNISFRVNACRARTAADLLRLIPTVVALEFLADLLHIGRGGRGELGSIAVVAVDAREELARDGGDAADLNVPLVHRLAVTALYEVRSALA